MRLLVIVSGDYGELGGAMYFLNGLSLASRPVLLLPAALKQPDLATAALDIRTYATLADIREVVKQFDPHTVMLFSGYLLTIGSRFSMFKALALFCMLHRRRVVILTSDPFLGMARGPTSLKFDEILRSCWHRNPIATWLLARILALRIFLMHRQLRRALHIYPAPIDRGHLGPAHRMMCYFNAAVPASAGPDADAGHMRPTWLFVLSRVDYDIQFQHYGAAFLDRLSSRLQDAARLGRRAVVIGPESLTVALRVRLNNEPDIELRSESAYSDYMRLIMGSEYTFFWNYFSFSVIRRVIAARPVFFFDEGHMVNILPALARIGVDSFYGGWKPPLLALGDVLEEERLTALAEDIRENFRRIRSRLESCPSPQALLDSVRRP